MLGLVASKVADALEADACFVYLYDEQASDLVPAVSSSSGRATLIARELSQTL